MTCPNAPSRLKCEYATDPVGIDSPKPRLSWIVNDARRGAIQAAYRVQVSDSARSFRHVLWDSGRVRSGSSVQVEYAGRPLASRGRYFWRVMTWDRHGAASPWSAPASWEMGLLRAGDWRAGLIGVADVPHPPSAPLFRKPFRISGEVVRARAYVTALGACELYLNGSRVGDDIFAPGWTDYRRRVMYRTHDVTDMVRRGENVAGAITGKGWYSSPLMGDPDGLNPGPPRFMLQLEIMCRGGRTETVLTDEDWLTAAGPIVSSELYAGENYDARRDLDGWDRPGYRPGKEWRRAAYFGPPDCELNAQADPVIRVTGEVTPVSAWALKGGRHVYDLGRNIVGVCRLRASGRRGSTVTLRHAELVNPDGTLSVENLRSAAATDRYTLKGRGVETWVPRFTYHGFRYVEVTGMAGAPDFNAITGLVLHTAPETTGTIETSSPLVNALHRNILNGQRGNMHSVLTDCPQRDERLGWMGDAQAFAPTACLNMDMAAVFAKFSRDMRDSVSAEGSFCDVSPRTTFAPADGSPAWADAGILVPWTVYRAYADTRILEDQYPAMKRFNDFVSDNNPDGLWLRRKGNDYGDWVPAGGVTDKNILSTLNFYHSTRIMEKVARILGRRGDEKTFAARARRTRDAFGRAYVRGNRIRRGSQTLNAMALAFGILPGRARVNALKDLVADIERRRNHLSTGFQGTQWLLPVLTESGRHDLALKLLLNRDYPSWGYMIGRGATTIWERWNSDTEGPAMNSRNHFAFGSVGEWLFRHLAGIDFVAEAPGYRRILVRPNPGSAGSEMDRCRALYRSIRGEIETRWRITADAFLLNVTIPANSSATVVLPVSSARGVTEDGVPLKRVPGVARIRRENGRAAFEIGAGSYRFRTPLT